MVKSTQISVLPQIYSFKKPPRNGYPPSLHVKGNVGGGTKGISEFVDGLRLTARQIGGGKETSQKHKRKRSGLPLLEGTLALGYTYIDILDEENDGMSFKGVC